MDMAKRNWKKYLNLLSRDNKFLALGIIAVASAFFFVFGIYPHLTSVRALLSSGTTEKQLLFAESVIKEPPKPKHIETPEAVKAIYMSSWVAGTPKWRAELVAFIKKSGRLRGVSRQRHARIHRGIARRGNLCYRADHCVSGSILFKKTS